MKLYVLFRYLENELIEPLVFTDYSKCMEAYYRLKIKAVDSGERVDEWNEVGGIEFTCMSEDMMARMCEFDVESTDNLWWYADAEDARYFQIGHVAVGSFDEMLVGFKEKANSIVRDCVIDCGEFEFGNVVGSQYSVVGHYTDSMDFYVRIGEIKIEQ